MADDTATAPAPDTQATPDGSSTSKPKKNKASKPKASKPKRKKDGTVADFGTGHAAVQEFNNRPSETHPTRGADGREVESPVATFRSATGHNEDKSVGGVN